MIAVYTYGKMIINGIPYITDVIIYPDKIDGNWQRKRGAPSVY